MLSRSDLRNKAADACPKSPDGVPLLPDLKQVKMPITMSNIYAEDKEFNKPAFYI